MKIQFKNISSCEWIYLTPSVEFHLCGVRTKYNWFHNLFPSKIRGFQLSIKWLFFYVFIDKTPDKFYI